MKRGGKCFRGFTLLEILVVVVILGIAVTAVTLSVGSKKSTQVLEEEARRLFSVFEYAAEYTLLKAKELGFYFESDKYQVLIQDPKGWQPLTGEKILAPRFLPERLKLYLSLEENNITLKKKLKDKTLTPQVLFLSSGEITPFEIRLTLIDKNTPEFTIRCTDEGEIILLRDGDKY